MKPRVIEQDRYELKIEFHEEDHGFCNLLRQTLLEEPAVEFTGYNIDPPLLASPVVTVRTKKSSRRQASVVLREALEKMLARTEEFRKDVNQAVSDYSVD